MKRITVTFSLDPQVVQDVRELAKSEDVSASRLVERTLRAKTRDRQPPPSAA